MLYEVRRPPHGSMLAVYRRFAAAVRACDRAGNGAYVVSGGVAGGVVYRAGEIAELRQWIASRLAARGLTINEVVAAALRDAASSTPPVADPPRP